MNNRIPVQGVDSPHRRRGWLRRWFKAQHSENGVWLYLFLLVAAYIAIMMLDFVRCEAQVQTACQWADHMAQERDGIDHSKDISYRTHGGNRHAGRTNI